MTYHDTRVELPPELRSPIVVERPMGSGTFVRLKDSYLRCIVYLGWPRAGAEDEIEPEGTGFLVVHDDAHYIVTAAHVAKNFKEVPFGVRLNKHADGTGQVEHLDKVEWFRHPDDKIDIAVMPFTPPAWARVNAFPTGSTLTEFKRESKNIGPGDLAYVVGIFKLLPGSKRNNPVVHVGHLASWAEGEEISTFDWRSDDERPPELKINGYLVQVHTMRQASGSPVFVRRTVDTSVPDPASKPEIVDGKAMVSMLKVGIHGSVWLLGLWHGAFSDDIGKRLGLTGFEKAGLEFGMGMGVCIPAPLILETLNQPELIAMRQAVRTAKTPTVIPQSASRTVARAGDGILRAALNTPPVHQKKPKAKRSKRGRGGVNSK